MRLMFITLMLIVMSVHLFAELPTLEFDPTLSMVGTEQALDLRTMNDEILEFLAKNLLLEKADVMIREAKSEEPIEDGKEIAKERLNFFKTNLKDSSIMAHEKLESNFKIINDLIDKHPSKFQRSPNGDKIFIEVAPKKVIEVSLIRLG